MAHLRNTKAPASFGELVWNTEDDVVEVDDADAHELLGIADGGFEEVVAAPKHSRKQVTEPDPDTTPASKK